MLARTRTGAVDGERVSKGHADAIRDDLGDSPFTVDQDRELVAPDAGQRVGIADATPKPLPDRAEQFVTAGVAEPVVELLEIVEIDEDQHEWATVDCLVEPLGERAAGWAARSTHRDTPDGPVRAARHKGAWSAATATWSR